MKNTILTLIILQYGICYGQVTFEKTYGGWCHDGGYSLMQTSDSGFIFTGYCFIDTVSGYDLYLVKTDFNGDLIWTKSYGGLDEENGLSVLQSADGGFVIAGYTQSSLTSPTDILLVKTQSNGDTLWCKKYGGVNLDWVSNIQKVYDGGYIIAGYTYSFGAGICDMLLIKTDSIGNLLWSKTYGSAGADYANYISQTADSGFIITGRTESFGAGYDDVLLVKTDLNGDTLWSKTFGGIYDDEGYEVHQTGDGGYIVAGTTLSSGFGNPHVILIKTDVNGNLLWTKVYGGGGQDRAFAMKQTTDGGYIVAGSSSSFGSGGYDIYLIKTDLNGDTLWTKITGGSDTDYGLSVWQNNDGGYAIGGLTYSFTPGYAELYFIKTDSNGNSCSTISPATQIIPFAPQISNPSLVVAAANITESSPSFLISILDSSVTICTSIGISEIDGPKTNISIYPNPFSDKITIHGTGSGEVFFYDLCGRLVLNQKTFSGETILNTEKISNGLYLLRYNDNNTIVNFKLIKQ